MSLFGLKEKQEIENLSTQLSKEQQENETLRVQIADAKLKIEKLYTQLSPEQLELEKITAQIEESREQLDILERELIGKTNDHRRRIDDLEADFAEKVKEHNRKLNDLKAEMEKAKFDLFSAKQEIIETNEAVLLQSFGMYEPRYNYSTSDEYKSKLKSVRDEQKVMIKDDKAINSNNEYIVNGSKAQGRKMVNDMKKLLLRAFNAECDDAVEHVKFNNISAYEKKINAAANAISKLGSIMQISIATGYVQLKLYELHLMHEYQVKKQEEKEAAKELRHQQREEAKAAKELEEARKKLEKEQSHYENALSRLNDQINKTKDEKEQNALLQKKADLEGQLSKINGELKNVDYRAANQRAGYVYVISNIGAFGENVYKIGMTRRLEPMDRVDELGDASVPFNFDVHAMIFTDDAPGLEAALHNAFADRKLNFVNQRREFFNVTLDEIKEVIRKNYDKTVEFVDVAPAEQYRESIRLKARS